MSESKYSCLKMPLQAPNIQKSLTVDRSENADLGPVGQCRSRPRLGNPDLCPVGQFGSGPDRKIRIWSRSENADLAPIGKCGSGPDRPIGKAGSVPDWKIQICSRSGNADVSMSALPTTANRHKQYLLRTGCNCGVFPMAIALCALIFVRPHSKPT